MLGAGLAELEYAIAAAALLLVVWLARELALAHRWRRLLRALERLADVLDDLAVVIVDEAELERDDDEAPPVA